MIMEIDVDQSHKDTTLVQFSLRSLFVVTSIAAAVSALIAPAAQDGNELRLVALWVGSYVLIVAGICWYRLRLETRAGKLLLRCRRRAWSVSTLFLVVPVIAITVLVIMPNSGDVMALQSGVMCAWVTICLWWRSTADDPWLEFFERGIVISRVGFRIWDEVLRFQWLANKPGRLKIQFRHDSIESVIHPGERDELNSLLTARLKHFHPIPPDESAPGTAI